jgi:hypothetical protein
LTIKIGTALTIGPEAAVEEGALGVALNALRVSGVEAGTVIGPEDVPDLEIGNVKVETVEGLKIATIALTDTVKIQGQPKLVVGEGGALALAVERPTLNADLPAAEVVNAAGGG